MALPEQPKTETMSVSESRRQYSDIPNRVYRNDERVVIEKNGIPVAAIVPVSDLRPAAISGQDRLRAIAAFRIVQNAFADVPEDELERELEKAMAEAKEIQGRARRSQDSPGHEE